MHAQTFQIFERIYISKITYTKKKHFKISVKSLVLSIISILEID